MGYWLRPRRLVALGPLLLSHSWGFTPKDSAHCLRWVAGGAPSRIRAEGVHGAPHDDDPLLCRVAQSASGDFADTCLPDRSEEAAVGEATRHLAVGTLPPEAGGAAAACVPVARGRAAGRGPASSANVGAEVEVAVVDPTCDVWWREVSADVIPPIPELMLSLGVTDAGAKLGLCRTFGDRPELDGGRRIVGTIALEGPDFGTCFFTRDDGTKSQLNGGTFHVLQARAAEPSCQQDPALAAELSDGLRSRIALYLTQEDRAMIEKITGSPFAQLQDEVLALGSCELRQVLSAARFVPSPLNVLGLHLLRALLAERLGDARAGARGLDTDPDFAIWRRDGVLIKDYDEVGDNGLHRLLQVASGEDVEAIPAPPYSWTPRNVTVTAEHDPQNEMHVDTFASIVKVWIFEQGVVAEDGPLEYVKGSHRETEGRLRWMYAYSLPPAKEALVEPSFRLFGSPSAMAASPDFVRHCELTSQHVLPLEGVKRTLVIADTSGLHRRARGVVGRTRRSLRLAGDNDGGLKRLDPYRLPPTGASVKSAEL